MNFLQPALLAALPLVSLPIIIHLINQRRYQTVQWAAMMFLLAANRMSRGYARLRQWLIMAFRMLAIAGLIFAVSRPLAGGLLGLTVGGRPDTTIVLLDRSPSMQQAAPGSGGTKLETALQQVVRASATLGSSRWVLIDGPGKPRELESAEALLKATGTGPIDAASDLPGLLQAALEYVKANKAGRTEIWIGSDLRENDWNAEGSRWTGLRQEFLKLTQGVRFHLLAYPDPAPDNLSIRVAEARWQKAGDGAELLLSLRIASEGKEEAGDRHEGEHPRATGHRRAPAPRSTSSWPVARSRSRGIASRSKRGTTAAGARSRSRATRTGPTTTSGSASPGPSPGARSSSPRTRRGPRPCGWPRR